MRVRKTKPEPASTPNEKPGSLLIAVDFGTTFSAVSYTLTARDDRQYVIKVWPDEDGHNEGCTSDEVPSTLLYDRPGKGYRWGFQIKENEHRLERFKLDLCPEAARLESYLNKMYPGPLAKAPELTQKTTDLVTDYLKKLHDHVLAHLKSKLGEVVIDTTTIEYVLTVPAVWTDKAKAATRACAVAAGFRGAIHMISEPEAAVTYVLDCMDPGTLKVGDTFVLVDGGGGTGDLISYVIEELGKVVKIREVAPGTGALCGSSYLNHIFRDFLLKRFADHPDWDDEILDDALHKFETYTKRHFRGEESDFIIPTNGLPADPALGLFKRGKLRLTLDEMLKIFEPVVSVMATLVQGQIAATATDVKAVLLVGGFGQSPYLKSVIKELVGDKIEVLQPSDGEVAVVKGALIRGLALVHTNSTRVRVSSRVARKSFGIVVGVPFNPSKHDFSDRYWCEFVQNWCAREMRWLIKKGDILREDVPLSEPLCCRQLISQGPFKDRPRFIYIYDENEAEDAPTEANAPGIRPHVVLTSALSLIPKKKLMQTTGKDKKKYYEISFEICTNFFSAHTEYSLWYDNNCYGKVEAEYE